MPNWNYNSVTIYAPIEKVEEYFVKEGKQLYFNMHKLFPDVFPVSDRSWEENWEYDWAIYNTGSKWFPDVNIHSDENDEHITHLSYDTARAPNNLTLQNLHHRTGRIIVNEYEEPGAQFEWTFNCINGTFSDEEREYQPSCEICERKKPWDAFEDEAEDMICKQCWKERNDE